MKHKDYRHFLDWLEGKRKSEPSTDVMQKVLLEWKNSTANTLTEFLTAKERRKEMTNIEKYVDLHKKWVKARKANQNVQASIYDAKMKRINKTLTTMQKDHAWEIITTLYPKGK